MLAYDQAHFSALVSMEQKDSAKEQGEGPALSCFCSVLFYSKVKMVAKKEETSPDGVSFFFFFKSSYTILPRVFSFKKWGWFGEKVCLSLFWSKGLF